MGKGVLHDVVHVTPAADKPHDQRMDLRKLLGDQGAERSLLPAADARQEFRTRILVQPRFHLHFECRLDDEAKNYFGLPLINGSRKVRHRLAL